ncbi:sigma-E processing peptidase SpoIIGA [uncultured Eubacterium sp.]|uniref:sigma-E processing peptidase SpoIIGA n=1 Tax=uncultured Eubacterium sp. TaxID=165185 RepID=UPI0015B8C79E|nr:sigma-E processing peptidase SpoIIGA [uncultured Eubacterium sp.]
MFYNQNVKGVIFIVVYVDILIIVNFFVNLLLLQITCLISKRSPKLYRIIISSCIGSLYSLVIFADNLNAVLCELSKLLASAVMVLIAFGFRRVLVFVKQLLIFYFSSVILLGVVMLVCFIFKLRFVAVNNSVMYFDVSSATLITCGVLAYIVSSIIIRLYNRSLSKNELYILKIENGECNVTLSAFLDTGNRLREPFSNSPVIIVNSSKISAGDKQIRIVPVTTVAGTSFLQAFKPDKIILKFNSREEIIENAYIALSDDLNDKSYNAILNYDILSI